MSQFPSAPPPGAYIPPNQSASPNPGFNTQQPNYGYHPGQQPQASPYGPPTPNYGPQSSQHKPTNAFGQVLNQAVTQGKPMLNKLGKTISSKLGNKQSQPTPHHLESFQNYQQHQQQSQAPSYQAQGQPCSPHSQQQQSAYQTQQSPFPHSNHGNPASGHCGPNNYFPQQSNSTSNAPAPPQQSNAPHYNPNIFAPSPIAGEQQGQNAQGQWGQGPFQTSHQPSPAGQDSGQQTGIIGQQSQFQNVNPQASHVSDAPSSIPNQGGIQQQQWSLPTSNPNHSSSPAPQQMQSFNPTPPPQQYNTPPPVPVHPNQNHLAQQPQPHQWGTMSPTHSHAQTPNQLPSISPPPPPASAHAPPEPPQQAQAPSPATQDAPPHTEFIAELPADMGSLSIMESSSPQRPSSNPSAQGSSYQAYRPTGSTQSQSPVQGFPIAAVSTSSPPVADPWRFADAATELPTREFYMIADLLFDGMDRKFEPHNTGLLEASKILESWKIQQDLAPEAADLFSYDCYSAFAKLWSLQGVPHVMVPCQPSLTPLWSFEQQVHSQEMKVPLESSVANAVYPSYMPALNRAGFYKYLFLQLLHEPGSLEKLIAAVCADTYKPGILNQPDVQKRDRNELPALASRAAAIQTAAVSRVCQDMAALMQNEQAPTQPQPAGGAIEQEPGSAMQGSKMQPQTNNMMQGGISMPSAAGYTYKPYTP